MLYCFCELVYLDPKYSKMPSVFRNNLLYSSKCLITILILSVRSIKHLKSLKNSISRAPVNDLKHIKSLIYDIFEQNQKLRNPNRGYTDRIPILRSEGFIYNEEVPFRSNRVYYTWLFLFNFVKSSSNKASS